MQNFQNSALMCSCSLEFLCQNFLFNSRDLESVDFANFARKVADFSWAFEVLASKQIASL